MTSKMASGRRTNRRKTTLILGRRNALPDIRPTLPDNLLLLESRLSKTKTVFDFTPFGFCSCFSPPGTVRPKAQRLDMDETSTNCTDIDGKRLRKRRNAVCHGKRFEGEVYLHLVLALGPL